MKILVVDDSKAMRMIVRRTLRQAGFGEHEVLEASNGAEALATIRAGGADLVLSDWNMPEMNGIELLTKVREEKLRVRIGLVTSENTPEMRERARAAGAVFIVGKPFTAEALQEALGSLRGARP